MMKEAEIVLFGSRTAELDVNMLAYEMQDHSALLQNVKLDHPFHLGSVIKGEGCHRPCNLVPILSLGECAHFVMHASR
jgi:hypothetical protein